MFEGERQTWRLIQASSSIYGDRRAPAVSKEIGLEHFKVQIDIRQANQSWPGGPVWATDDAEHCFD